MTPHSVRTLSLPTLMLLAGGLAACDAGSAGGGGGNPDGPVRIPSDDPSVDARLDALGIICQSTLILTGTFTEGAARPDGETGCWPVGNWSIQAALDVTGCDPQVELAEPYLYDVTQDEDGSDVIIFASDPADERVNLKISVSGDNLCYGTFEHFGLDRHVVSLRPTLAPDGTVAGIGTYSVHELDPF